MPKVLAGVAQPLGLVGEAQQCLHHGEGQHLGVAGLRLDPALGRARARSGWARSRSSVVT